MIMINDFSYKDILCNININLEQGVTYIRGENGSGKSTFLDCIAQLNDSYNGKITTDEKIIYLSQNIYFSMRLTSKDLIQFVLLLDNIKDYKNTFFEYVEYLNESGLFIKIWDTPIGMLSGGERTKLFFAVFTCLDRDWYIFDEPFAGVDEQGKLFMIEIIKDLQNKKKGVIITSHEISPLEAINNVRKLSIKNKTLIEEC